jgi:hypothetical protein
LLGEDYGKDVPQAGKPVADTLLRTESRHAPFVFLMEIGLPAKAVRTAYSSCHDGGVAM